MPGHPRKESLRERLYRLLGANAVDIPIPGTNRAIPMVALSDIGAVLQGALEEERAT
jgi:hypothetical protein